MGTSKYPELNAITLDTQKKNSTWSFICNFFKIKILDLRDILFSLSIKHELNSGSSRCSSIGESVRLKYTEFVRLGVRFAPSTFFSLFIKKIYCSSFWKLQYNSKIQWYWNLVSVYTTLWELIYMIVWGWMNEI